MIAVIGMVAGRVLHSLVVEIEDLFGVTNHREKFEKELDNPSDLDGDTIEKFTARAETVFDLNENHSDFYMLTRAYIHADSRGRSRTFQAIYAFYRSISLVALIHFIAYMLYIVLGVWFGMLSGTVSYVPYIDGLGIHPTILFLLSICIFMGTFVFTKRSRIKYREYFIQYLIGDFLVLTSNYEGEENVDEDQEGEEEPIAETE